MKEQVGNLARYMWMEAIHRDNATDEEKERLIERARKSAPMSRMYAFLHPFLMMRAYRDLMRYQGKTWFWPRLMWLGLIAGFVYFLRPEVVKMLDSATSLGEVVATVVSMYVMAAAVVLFSHFVTTNTIRLNETCVWCHVVQRNSDGLIAATLSVLAYRLPFIEPSRTVVSPWERDTGTYWKTSRMDVTLETAKEMSQLSFADIYDENVCGVRSVAAIPPSAKRYAVGMTKQHGDIIIKEKRGLDLGLGPQFRTVIIGGVITAVCTALGIFGQTIL